MNCNPYNSQSVAINTVKLVATCLFLFFHAMNTVKLVASCLLPFFHDVLASKVVLYYLHNRRRFKTENTLSTLAFALEIRKIKIVIIACIVTYCTWNRDWLAVSFFFNSKCPQSTCFLFTFHQNVTYLFMSNATIQLILQSNTYKLIWHLMWR